MDEEKQKIQDLEAKVLTFSTKADIEANQNL